MANYAQFATAITVRLDSGSTAAFAQLSQAADRSGRNTAQAMDRITRSASGVEGKIRGAAAAFGAFEGYGGRIASRLNAIANTFTFFGAQFGGLIGATAGAAGLVSATTNLQNYQARLTAATASQEEFASSFAMLQKIANSTRSDFGETLAFYVRLKTATEQLGTSQQQLGQIVTTVQQAIRLSGAGTQESTAALTQFVQGLSSANGLSGDEFKSLGENATVVLQAIAQGVKEANLVDGFDGTISSLRQLGKEGKLTADVLVPALNAVADNVEQRFNKLPPTIEQSTQVLKNNLAILAAEAERATGILAGLAAGIGVVADNLRGAATIIGVTAAGIAGRFVAIAAQATLATLSISRLAVVMTGGSIVAASGQVTSLASAMGRLGIAARGVLAFFGGPWGVAFSAAAAAVTYLLLREGEAEKSTRLFGKSQVELDARVRRATEAILGQKDALAGLIKEQDALSESVRRNQREENANEASRNVQIQSSSLAAQLRLLGGSGSSTAEGRNVARSLAADLQAGEASFAEVLKGIDRIARQGNLPASAAKTLLEARKRYSEAVQAFNQAAADSLSTLPAASNSGGFGGFGNARTAVVRSIADLNAASERRESPEQRKAKALEELAAKYKNVEKASKATQAAYIEERRQILERYEAEAKAIESATTKAQNAAKKAMDEIIARNAELVQTYAPLTQAALEYAQALRDIAEAQGKGLIGAGDAATARAEARDRLDEQRQRAVRDKIEQGGSNLFDGGLLNVEFEKLTSPRLGEAIGDKIADGLTSRSAQIGNEIGRAIGGAFGRVLQRAGGIGSLLESLQSGQGSIFNTAFSETIGNAFRPAVKLLDDLVGSSGDTSRLLGKAFGGAAIGSAIAGGANALGIGLNSTGSAIGGALGELGKSLKGSLGGIFKSLGDFAGPLGSIVGGLIGNLVGGIGVTPRAYQQVSVNQFGQVVGGATRARGSGQAENLNAAQQLADSLVGAVNALTRNLGATLQSGASLGEIGISDKRFSFKRVAGDRQPAQYFNEAGDAVAAAVRNAIQTGVVQGLRNSTKNLLLASGNFEDQVQKAVDFEGVFKSLRQATDPVGAAIDELNLKFKGLQATFAEAGATAEEYAQLQQLYDRERADILKEQVNELKDYLTELTTSSSNGLSARDRQRAALENFAGFRADIEAGRSIDQGAFRSAADTLLGVNRELYGSQQEYFDTLAQVTNLTKKAISDAENVVSIADALRFANEPVTQGLGRVEQAINNGFANLASQLGSAMIPRGANDNGGGGGGGNALWVGGQFRQF